ncbi:serine/threonine protein kinase, partial [Planctomycetota bacterium]
MVQAVCPRCNSQIDVGINRDKAGLICIECGHEMVVDANESQVPSKEVERLPMEPEPDPYIGLIIDGCRLTDLIARGGMGLVYKAKHLVLKKNVAIKILSSTMAFDREYIDRFLSEAKLAAQLDHTNIIQIHDVGKQKGVFFIHMQYVDGESVRDLIEKKGLFDPLTALRIAGHTAEGLACAHNNGIVHRDIKPANIMIDKSGVVKIADFGLAKNVHLSQSRTVTGQVLGTPYFMSPEQCGGQQLDHRSDQYSLGATLYYMLVGQYPFDAEETLNIMLKHKQEPLTFTSAISDLIPPPVQALIKRMMAKNPRDRFQTTQELIAAIISIIREVKSSGKYPDPEVFDESGIHVLPVDMTPIAQWDSTVSTFASSFSTGKQLS